MVPVLILAAGLGTRIRAIAGDRPKPLIGFGGAPILAHNLRWLAGAGVRDVWINLHYRAELIQDSVGDGSAFGLRVQYLHEPDLLGTAGAYGNLRRQPGVPDGTGLVVYGDNLLKLDIAGLLAAHRARSAACTVCLFDRAAHSHTGIAGGRVELRADGRIDAFVEGAGAPPAGQRDLVNAGVYAIEPAVAALIPPSGPADFGRDVFPAMLAAGDGLYGHVIEPGGYCLGLDTPESYAAGMQLLEGGKIMLAA